MIAPSRRILFAASLALAWGCGAVSRDLDESGAPQVDAPLVSESKSLEPATVKAGLAAALASGKVAARCAYTKLGQRAGEVYVWTLCEAFDGARVVWAASQPAVVVVDWSAGTVVSIRVPGDGDRYAKDAERLFPESLQSIVLQKDAGESNRRMSALEAALARE